MTSLKIELVLQKKQKEAFDKSFTVPVLFYGGAKGGGKSYLVRARELYRRLNYPNSRGLIIRRSYPELLSNHIRMFFKEYPYTRDWYNKSEKTIYYPNGSTTEFSYLRNQDDVYTYQGREYDDISIDEITQHEEDTFKILRSSLRTSNPDILPTMLLTGNPGGIGHQWVKRIFIDRQLTENEKPEDYAYIPAKIYDNRALLDADPAYIQRLRDLPHDMARAYLEGDWDVFSGQYFEEYRAGKHVCKPFTPKSSLPKVGGIDWGYDPGYFVFLASVIATVKLDSGVSFYRVFTYKEIDGQKTTPEEWGRRINDEVKLDEFSNVMCDPSMFKLKEDGTMSLRDQLTEPISDHKWLFKQANNKRIPGWTHMHKWLSLAPDGMPYWVISENCTDLIRTLPQCVHDEKQPEDVDPLGGILHWPDAARYMLNSIKWVDGKSGQIFDKTESKIPEFHWGVNPDDFAKVKESNQDWRAL